MIFLFCFGQDLPIPAVQLFLLHGGEAAARHGRRRLPHAGEPDAGGGHDGRRLLAGLPQRCGGAHHSRQLRPECPPQRLRGCVFVLFFVFFPLGVDVATAGTVSPHFTLMSIKCLYLNSSMKHREN